MNSPNPETPQSLSVAVRVGPNGALSIQNLTKGEAEKLSEYIKNKMRNRPFQTTDQRDENGKFLFPSQLCINFDKVTQEELSTQLRPILKQIGLIDQYIERALYELKQSYLPNFQATLSKNKAGEPIISVKISNLNAECLEEAQAVISKHFKDLHTEFGIDALRIELQKPEQAKTLLNALQTKPVKRISITGIDSANRTDVKTLFQQQFGADAPAEISGDYFGATVADEAKANDFCRSVAEVGIPLEHARVIDSLTGRITFAGNPLQSLDKANEDFRLLSAPAFEVSGKDNGYCISLKNLQPDADEVVRKTLQALSNDRRIKLIGGIDGIADGGLSFSVERRDDITAVYNALSIRMQFKQGRYEIQGIIDGINKAVSQYQRQ